MTTQLYYFNYYNTEDDIVFVDCLKDFPSTFNNWFDYHDFYYFDFYSQYHKTCTDKLTGFNRPTSLEEAFFFNTDDVAVCSDLDYFPSDVSVSDTPTTKVDNMNCLNVPEKEAIPPSSMNYLQLIPRLKIKFSKKKEIPSLLKKKNNDLSQLDILYALDKEKQSKSSPLSNKMGSNIAMNSCKHEKQSKKRGICALPLETNKELVIAVNLADLCINHSNFLTFPNTYTIIDSDVLCDTPNLQADWILPCADKTDSF